MEEKELINLCKEEMDLIILQLREGKKVSDDIFLKNAGNKIGKVRRTCGESLGKRGKICPDTTYTFLAQYLMHQDDNVRWTVSIALGELGSNNFDLVMLDLRRMADDAAWSVREAVASALIVIGMKNAKVVPELIDWASDSKENVRRAVAESIGRGIGQKDYTVALKILVKMSDDSSLYVRKAVANSFRNMSRKYGELVIETLNEWKKSQSEFTRWIIIDSCRELIRSEANQVCALLFDLATDERKSLQSCMVSVLKEGLKKNKADVEQQLLIWRESNNQTINNMLNKIL